MKRPALPPVRLLAVAAGCVLLAACASSTPPSYPVKEAAGQGTGHGIYKVGKPYQIQGVWYYPAEDYDYDETGIASWYGPDFHGRYTANGEIFDQNGISAAHRTLPMPCFVRVTNLENGRSLVVRVNDRGPFAHSRILDLSRRAAQLLGIIGQGTAKVRVQILAEESRELAMRMKAKEDVTSVAAAPRILVQAETLPPPGSHGQPKPIVMPAPPPDQSFSKPAPDAQALEHQRVKVEPVHPTHMFIQAGAFSRFDNANRLSVSLSTIGKTTITQLQTKSGTFFRVRMGPIASLDAADALLEKVINSGYPDARLVVD